MSTHSRKCIVRKLSLSVVLVGLVSLCFAGSGFPPAQAAASAGHASPVGMSCPPSKVPGPQAVTPATAEDKRKAIEALNLSPAVFAENKGQWDNSVRYAFDGRRMRVSFADAGPVFMTRGRAKDGGEAAAIFSARFVGAKAVTPAALEPARAKMSYYHGSDAAKWHRGVPAFAKVAYKGLYDGVDLYAWGKRSGLEYEFHVAPGASWRQIVVRYEGIEGLSVDEKGALHAKTALGEMIDAAPVAYQETAEGRRAVAANFRMIDGTSYGFKINGEVDASLPLVIDPDLAYASYLGGNGYDSGSDIAVDADGNVWVALETYSTDMPTTAQAAQSANAGAEDAYVALFSPAGELICGTYLGGADYDEGYAVMADADGNAWVAGSTWSTDFPVTADAFQKVLSGNSDAFLAKVTPDGELAWSSLLGGSNYENCYGGAIDSSGNVWMTGDTGSDDFPTPGGFLTEYFGQWGVCYVARISPAGTLDWASYLSGSYDSGGLGVATDADGNAWVAGWTSVGDFPTPGGFKKTMPASDGQDAFVAKITPAGNLAWASLIGGSDSDAAIALALDVCGNVWVTGWTDSRNFPSTGGFKRTLGRGDDEDCFVARITPAGKLAFSTYLGGGASDDGMDIQTDVSCNAWVTGYTYSTDFPVTAGAFQTALSGDKDAFVAKITALGALSWSTYLGGSGSDMAFGMVNGPLNSLWIVGEGSSTDFPVTADAYQATSGGGYDAFVAKIQAETHVSVTAPDDSSVYDLDTLPTFTYALDPLAGSAYIDFSSSPYFPKNTKRADGQIDRTLHFKLLPASSQWQPTDAEWQSVKQIVCLEGVIHWRVEQMIAAKEIALSEARSIVFDWGAIDDLTVTPSHIVDAKTGIWPDKDVPPLFSATDNSTGMAYFFLDVSSASNVPQKDAKHTITFGGGKLTATSYQTTAADWLKIRRLATTGGGTLYWRFRAQNAAKTLTVATQPVPLVMDGGDWTVSALDLSAAPPQVSWTLSGQGIAGYSVQFCATDAFPATGGSVLTIPSAPVAASPYTFSSKDVGVLNAFANKNGVTSLYYRMRAVDADNAFVTYSAAQSVAVP